MKILASTVLAVASLSFIILGFVGGNFSILEFTGIVLIILYGAYHIYAYWSDCEMYAGTIPLNKSPENRVFRAIVFVISTFAWLGGVSWIIGGIIIKQ